MKVAMPNADLLIETLKRRIVIIDGAMGTMIQAHKLEEADYRGKEFAHHERDLRLCNDVLNITQPAIIEDIHLQYLEAGADIIETNTFNANAISMAEYRLQGHVYDLNKAGAQAARRAAGAVHARESRAPLLGGGFHRPHQPHGLCLAGHCQPRGARRDLRPVKRRLLRADPGSRGGRR